MKTKTISKFVATTMLLWSLNTFSAKALAPDTLKSNETATPVPAKIVNYPNLTGQSNLGFNPAKDQSTFIWASVASDKSGIMQYSQDFGDKFHTNIAGFGALDSNNCLSKSGSLDFIYKPNAKLFLATRLFTSDPSKPRFGLLYTPQWDENALCQIGLAYDVASQLARASMEYRFHLSGKIDLSLSGQYTSAGKQTPESAGAGLVIADDIVRFSVGTSGSSHMAAIQLCPLWWNDLGFLPEAGLSINGGKISNGYGAVTIIW